MIGRKSHSLGPVDLVKLQHYRRFPVSPTLVIFDQDAEYLDRVMSVLRNSPVFNDVCVIPTVYDGKWPIVLPKDVSSVDIAFNDDEQYDEFAKQFVPLLSKENGLIGFHNTYGMWKGNAICLRSLEWVQSFDRLTICEPMKFNQNSLTLFKKKQEEGKWWDVFSKGEYVLEQHVPLTGNESGVIGEWANVLKIWKQQKT